MYQLEIKSHGYFIGIGITEYLPESQMLEGFGSLDIAKFKFWVIQNIFFLLFFFLSLFFFFLLANPLLISHCSKM